ncbi:MAG: hypothetical protein B7733_15290 [Myxococcales bacterium FL481]|nr:MAG: hypothetical protein B7733_15290 [Myxococcales bacterium FL481]
MLRKRRKPPKHLVSRLSAVAKDHKFSSVDAVVEHFLTRGLAQFPFLDASAPLDRQLDQLVDERGYAGVDEAIEHLLLRGLRAYETTTSDPKALEERLRGLGYID